MYSNTYATNNQWGSDSGRGQRVKPQANWFESLFNTTNESYGFQTESTLSRAALSVRLGFLRKVYGILSIQLAFTTLVSIAIMYHAEAVQLFVMTNSWVLLLNSVVTLGITVSLMWKEARTNYPYNFILLGAFTFLNSLTVGMFASMYDAWLVCQAFVLTTCIVVSLTLYTFQSTRDFKWTGAILYSLLAASLLGGLSNMFFRSSMMETGLSVLGAFIFSAYIIYDTQMIMRHVSAEEYIVAVINLYLDIINLFIKIVKILNASKNSQVSNNNKKKRNNE